MPPVSQAQRRLFWWAKNNPQQAQQEKGIKPSVSSEFTGADPGGKLPARVSNGKPIGGPSPRKPFGSLAP